MERTNNVPTDIARRRAIADILGIPYVLLGLSESLAKTPLTTAMPELETGAETPRVPKRETVVAAILTEHEQVLTSYIRGYYHRHGQAAIAEVTEATEQVRLWLPQTREHVQQRGLTLISRYHQFGRAVACEQQQYALAMSHADQAIEYAQAAHAIKPNTDLMAIAFYRRGVTSFKQETTCIDQESDYRDAVAFIDAALAHAQSATPVMKGFVSLGWSLIHAHTATSEKEKSAVREGLLDAYNAVAAYGGEDDIYALKYDASWYHLVYAKTMIGLGEYAEAIGASDVAEELTPLNLPRRFAYIDALRAMASFGLGEFEETVGYIRDALIGSRAVKSEFNIGRTAKVYRQLRANYKRSSDVTELGRELAKTHPHLV